MTPTESLTVAAILTGCFFFLAGTVGFLRLPDTLCRLHALTKADNLGLGFIAIGLALQAHSWVEVFRLFVIWLLALLSSSAASYLIGQQLLTERNENST